MGRAPIRQDQRLPRLMPRQRMMLLLAIAAGQTERWSPARSDSAWTVRIGGHGQPSVVVTFRETVGLRLVDLGYLAPHPDPAQATIVGSGRTVYQFIPTEAGISRVRGKEPV
jgi:hypothetical protein